MKSKLVSSSLVAAVLSLSAYSVQAQDLDFELINQSSSDMVGFFVSHSGTKQWEENLLDGAYLPAGNVVTVNIRDGREVCEYDIKAIFEDDSAHEEYEMDLCELGEYTYED